MDPVPAPAATAAPDVGAPVIEPASRCLALMREARGLIKQGKKEAGLAAFGQAVRDGLAAKIDAETQSLLHYAYGLVLQSAEQAEEAVGQLRQAALLAPGDSEFRSDLAAALLDEEEYDEAIAQATAGLALQPEEKLARELRTTLSKARTERLRQRLSVSASAAIGYDSNILQGTTQQGVEYQTIAGRSTRSAGRTAAAMAARTGMRTGQADSGALAAGFAAGITSIYNTPAPSRSEDGVPITIELGAEGRLAATQHVELWLGYDFSQTFQTLPDQDSYNFQEHELKLRLSATLLQRLTLDLSAAGFVNLSGLSAFAPFQGGITGALGLTLRESKRWRTVLRYAHRYAASFAAEDTELNADSDELRLAQELRLWPSSRLFKLRLGYRLRDVRSGVLVSTIPYEVTFTTPMPRGTATPMTRTLGEFRYTAPLGSLGNQLTLGLLVKLPAALTLSVDTGYEYRLYDGAYAATFTPAEPQITLPQGRISTSVVMLPGVQRADHIVSIGASLERELPSGFSLTLNYTFLDNLSNIANSLDNRSFMKHTVTLTAGYSF